MNVLVCGANGCVGRAVVSALRWRGHRVIEGSRRPVPGADATATLWTTLGLLGRFMD